MIFIKSIWIESEEKGVVTKCIFPDNDNSDVIITFTDNRRYVATFFTYRNIEWLRQTNKPVNA